MVPEGDENFPQFHKVSNLSHSAVALEKTRKEVQGKNERPISVGKEPSHWSAFDGVLDVMTGLSVSV
ncbi:hypothetical protein E4U55_000559 [Claviceps digitariae]|nr:hypothetical protein E4U55_000559 [Claviceps digitariae]